MIYLNISAIYAKILEKICTQKVRLFPLRVLFFFALWTQIKIFLPAKFSQCLLTTDRLSPAINQSLWQTLLLYQQSLRVIAVVGLAVRASRPYFGNVQINTTIFRFLVESSPLYIHFFVMSIFIVLGVHGCIILGWISRRWDMGMWTGLGWPRTGTGGRRL